MSFEALNLHSSVLKAIHDSGYTVPTPIQQQAIPELIAGHDVLASAQTGTGKTAAFMLPALHLLAAPVKMQGRGPRILVLTPTRELALQVSEAAKKYGKYLPRIKVVSILGGMPYPLQNRLLSQPVDILVATPGRLIDHLQRGRIDFKRLQMMVLDEADRMLDMGFIDDVEIIAAATPPTRQTLLFSATLDDAIDKVASKLLKSPKEFKSHRRKPRWTILNNGYIMWTICLIKIACSIMFWVMRNLSKQLFLQRPKEMLIPWRIICMRKAMPRQHCTAT